MPLAGAEKRPTKDQDQELRVSVLTRLLPSQQARPGSISRARGQDWARQATDPKWLVDLSSARRAPSVDLSTGGSSTPEGFVRMRT